MHKHGKRTPWWSPLRKTLGAFSYLITPPLTALLWPPRTKPSEKPWTTVPFCPLLSTDPPAALCIAVSLKTHSQVKKQETIQCIKNISKSLRYYYHVLVAYTANVKYSLKWPSHSWFTGTIPETRVASFGSFLQLGRLGWSSAGRVTISVTAIGGPTVFLDWGFWGSYVKCVS